MPGLPDDVRMPALPDNVLDMTVEDKRAALHKWIDEMPDTEEVERLLEELLRFIEGLLRKRSGTERPPRPPR